MKIYLISSIVLLCNAFLAQNDKQERDTVFLSQIYLDESTYLVSQKVIDFDSISASELLIRFENWGGQNFRNYEKVRTSKTETQITLNYITSTFNTALDFYLIMVVEFKDNKIINGYSPAQRFFIAYAQLWKINYTEAELKNRIANDSHSPGMYRVNGPLMNCPEFFEAFSVKEGDKMRNSNDKVSKIW